MHKSAMVRMKWFVDNYIPKDKKVSVLDVGSQDVNGSYRQLFNNTLVNYVGLDMCPGSNVNIVPKDPYNWKEIKDSSFDFIISGNAFEHIEYPWLTIKEIYKKLKQNGFICILAPFAHVEHRYPTDCYRYLADGLIALARWGGFQVVESTVGGIPSGTHEQQWICTDQNYDDSMVVAAKTNDIDSLKSLPRFNATRLTRKWIIV